MTFCRNERKQWLGRHYTTSCFLSWNLRGFQSNWGISRCRHTLRVQIYVTKRKRICEAAVSQQITWHISDGWKANCDRKQKWHIFTYHRQREEYNGSDLIISHCLTCLEIFCTKSLKMSNTGIEVTKFLRSDGKNYWRYWDFLSDLRTEMFSAMRKLIRSIAVAW